MAKVALVLIINSILHDMTYAIVISVPIENNRYIIYITTYRPIGVCMFNIAQIALHTLQERIHFLWKGVTRHSEFPMS
jgi:hypothetical protein